MSSFLLFVLFMAVIVGLFVVTAWHRSKQIHALMETGIATQGTLTHKRKQVSQKRMRFMLVYEYSADGMTRSGHTRVSREEFERHVEGEVLPLRYLQDKPTISAPEFVIQQMRDAKARLAK